MHEVKISITGAASDSATISLGDGEALVAYARLKAVLRESAGEKKAGRKAAKASQNDKETVGKRPEGSAVVPARGSLTG